MSEFPPCPKCKSDLTYPSDGFLVCPICFHEWNENERTVNGERNAITSDEDVREVKDSNGNILQDGDSVIVIKDLPVKGAPKPVKAGTKVKNIRLTDGDHNIDCKIEGFGSMALKSEFVRKA
jgi:protein PhnA